MLPNIKQFFESHFIASSNSSDVNSEQQLHLAIAALMIEVIESDYEDSPEEQESLRNIIKRSFQLKADEADQLIALAKQEHTDSTDYFQFTRLINQNYSESQRIQLIEKLWEIAFADKVLDKHEEHVIKRIGDLIYVSRSDLIAAKLRAQH